ncbi:MAG: hypothetical protein JW769_01000 [Parachlamydiales bacterium]|nr:hypothetical protein [Parachlamydiales bacterium]
MNKSIPPLPPNSEKPVTPAPEKKESKPFQVNEEQPFKQMAFSSAQKQKFWSTMITQMQETINQCLARAKRSSEALKKSIEDQE